MENKKTKFRYDEYMDMRTWKRTPVTDAWKDKLADDLYRWAKEDPEAFKISEFYLDRGINSTDFARWAETHEKLKMAHTAALQLLGNRREKNAAKNKMNPSVILPIMHRYDKEWKESAEWRAALKAKAEGEGDGTIRVLVENYNENPDPKPVKKIKKLK